MACKYICDGCGKEESATEINGKYHKPSSWFIRGDKDGVQVACSRTCIEKISEKTGVKKAICPF